MRIEGPTFLLVALIVAGCAAGPTPTPPSPSTETPAMTPESTNLPDGSRSPAPTGPAELVAGAGELPAGSYTRSGFDPPITFTLEDGWVAGSLVAGFFDVQQDPGTPDVVAVQFANVVGAIGDDGAVVPVTTAAEAAATIAANPGIIVLGESDSRVGGLAGRNVEIENRGTGHAGVLDVPPGILGIDPGRRLWISVFDTDAGVLAIMVGGSVARWDRTLELAEPVLESVVVGS